MKIYHSHRLSNLSPIATAKSMHSEMAITLEDYQIYGYH